MRAQADLTSRQAGWRRGAPALTAGLAALALLASALLPIPAGPRLPGSGAGSVLSLRHVLAIAAGGLLLALARSLWRGKRRALLVAVAGLWGATAVAAAAGASLPEALGGLAAGALLLADRRAFPHRGVREGRSCRLCGGLAVAAALAAYLVAVASLAAERAVGVSAALERGASWLLEGAWWLHSWTPSGISLDVLVLVALASAAVFVRGLLRPAEGADGHTPEMHRRAAELVARHGTDSLHPFVLREDKSFHFAHGGFLAYRVLAATAVVSGDPIGPPGTAPAILTSFERFAAEHGWTVVITGASVRHVEAYRGLGFNALRIGDEAVVDPAAFSLEGRVMRKVRQSVHRLQRRGWSVEVVEGRDLTRGTTPALARIEREWRSAQPRLHGFAMTLGRLWGAEEDVTGVYVLARDPEHQTRGFLRFASYRDGLSLDVMRRPPEAPNGANEAMVAAALAYARERGLREVSLNFAGFAHVMAADAALTRGQRVLRFALHRLHARFQLERLVTFNDKFLPAWRPRYLIHRGRAVLPLAALRVLQAEAYIRPPSPRPLERRWEPRAEPVLR